MHTLKKLEAKTPHMEQKKICHPSDCCQNDATSSNANSSPPTGALKSLGAHPPAESCVCEQKKVQIQCQQQGCKKLFVVYLGSDTCVS